MLSQIIEDVEHAEACIARLERSAAGMNHLKTDGAMDAAMNGLRDYIDAVLDVAFDRWLACADD